MHVSSCTQISADSPNIAFDNRALSVLSLKDNSLCNREAGKVLSEMLAVNTVLKVLDVSSNQSPANDFSARDGPGFAQELAVGLSDNGALSVANVMGNRIGKEQLAKLQEIMRAKPSLVSLCGIADGATEADLSGLKMDADDAAILASELPDKGAILKLTFTGGTNTGDFGSWVEGGPVTLEAGQTEANFSNKKLGVPGAIIISAWLSNGKDKGAMTSLNLSANSLGATGAMIIAEAIKVTTCTPAIILVPFSCPSDFSINCCCLLLSAGYEGPIVRKSSQEWH